MSKIISENFKQSALLAPIQKEAIAQTLNISNETQDLYAKMFRANRKIGMPIPLPSTLAWARDLALEGCQLPRGKKFDKYRDKNRNIQYENIISEVRKIADVEKEKLTEKKTGAVRSLASN